MASICYKDEDKLLDGAVDVENVYVEEVLPQKMKYNLDDIKKFSFYRELKIMFLTVGAACRFFNSSKGSAFATE